MCYSNRRDGVELWHMQPGFHRGDTVVSAEARAYTGSEAPPYPQKRRCL